MPRTGGVSRPPHPRQAMNSARPEGAAPAGDDDLLFVRQSPIIETETSGPRKIKVGVPAEYKVTVNNAGDVVAEELLVTVRLPEWAEVVGTQPTTGSTRPPKAVPEADGLQWTIARLEPGGREELELRIIPRKSRPFDLAVEWAHSPVTSQAMVDVQEAKLLMAISGPDEVFYGEKETYKLNVSNPGTGDAENVMVRLLPASPGEEEIAGHRIGLIRAGESKVIELELTAHESGPLTIKAEATADGGQLRASVVQEVTVRRAQVEVEITGPAFQYAGTTATYKVRVFNPGNADAQDVHVAAMIPPGGKYLSSNNGGRRGSDAAEVTWNLTTLRAGGEAEFEFKCELTEPGPNRPQVVCVADEGLRDSAMTSTEVEALADLVLSVVDPQGPVAVDTDVVYEVHIRNRGAKSAKDVDVASFFSDGIDPVSVEGSPHEIGAGQVIFQRVPTIEAGEELVLRVTARAQMSGNHIFRTELKCDSLGTTLAAEETTRFYGDEQRGGSSTPAERKDEPNATSPDES